jgi:hypothetical protein
MESSNKEKININNTSSGNLILIIYIYLFIYLFMYLYYLASPDIDEKMKFTKKVCKIQKNLTL